MLAPPAGRALLASLLRKSSPHLDHGDSSAAHVRLEAPRQLSADAEGERLGRALGEHGQEPRGHMEASVGCSFEHVARRGHGDGSTCGHESVFRHLQAGHLRMLVAEAE